MDDDAVLGQMVPSAAAIAWSLVNDYPPVDVCVRALNWQCWRCKRRSPAFGVVHVDGVTDPYSVIPAVDGIALEYVRDLLILTGSPLAATIKVRYSRSAGGSYTSNGCIHCDALFGAFHIHEEISALLADRAVETMSLLVRTPRPQLEMFLLDADRSADRSAV